MTDTEIVRLLNKWQKDMMTKTRGVWVSYYNLNPQAQGFSLHLKIHEDGISDSEMGDDEFTFFGGTMSAVFEKAVTWLSSKKKELIDALTDE